jgi:hypothetical protein
MVLLREASAYKIFKFTPVKFSFSATFVGTKAYFDFETPSYPFKLLPHVYILFEAVLTTEWK